MKIASVTFLSFAAAAILVGAIFYAIGIEIRVEKSYRAEISMQELLASVRRFSTATKALRSDQGDFGLLLQDWSRSRTEFDGARRRLTRDVALFPRTRQHLLRLANTWERIERNNASVVASIQNLDRAGFRRLLGSSGLLNKYQELLLLDGGADSDIGELGLLLFNIEHTSQLAVEVEGELFLMGERLKEETADNVVAFEWAGVSAVVIAVLLVIGLLARIRYLFLALERDNAARTVAENAAKASETDLTITLDSIGEGVIATDRDGRLKRLNPAAEKLLLRSEPDCVGRFLAELCTLHKQGLREQIEDPVTEVLCSGVALGGGDAATLGRSDGTERQVSLIATPIRGPENQIKGVVVVIQDVTDRQALEEQLRRTQKLESIGQLAGGVAHDFNNYLQVVRANANLLRDDPRLPEESLSNITEIEEATSRAADLTRQLLAFGRRQTLQVRNIDVAVLVKTALSLIRRIIGETIRIDYSAEEPLAWVRADPGQLEQVVVNLCVNARDAMPDGGTLRVALRGLRLSSQQTAQWPWAREGEYVELSVTDTGKGIDRETLARIFDPFFTTKPVGKGTGLGLSVVQGIVHQHGGFIDVRSEPDIGSTFRVYLPCSQQQRRPSGIAERTEEAGRPATASGGLLLLVEDDSAVRRITELVLQRNGYRVLTACDGEEACHLAALHVAELSVAVLDVVMPRLGGVEAARRIRALRPDIGIVLCSGYTGGLPLLSENDGDDWEILSKPYTNADLLDCLRRVIESHGDRNQG